MRFIELFAGIGGFRYGLESVVQHRQRTRMSECVLPNRDSTNSKGESWEDNKNFTCVWANEIDKYAAQIYRRNYGSTSSLTEQGEGEGVRDEKRQGSKRDNKCADGLNSCPELYEGDITKVKAEDIPDHDLLVGGFPCQAFSIAGKRGGFEDTRGTLFFEIARIAQEKRPRYLLLENVKGLLSHDKGRTFGAILTTLDEIGYDCQWQVLNSKNFGVPQNRERVFIVGHLRGTSRPEVFPITGESENHGLRIKGRITGISGHDILKRCYGIEGVVPALNTCGGGNTESKIAIPVLTPDRPKKRQNGRRFKDDGEPSFTLTGQDKHGGSDGLRIRRLTPTECCRLQGFPDSWCNIGLDKDGKETIISDSQKYKCLGNAVTTNVVDEIGKRLIV